MIIPFINNKGGVGKTTTLLNFAEELGMRGYKVLVVDLDGQASSSMSLGIKRVDLDPSLVDVVFPPNSGKNNELQKVIRKDVLENVDLITSKFRLYNFDVKYGSSDNVKVTEIHSVIKNLLEPVKASYDFILLDCPPAFTLLTINALIAADKILIPITLNYLAVEGFMNLLEMIEVIEEGVHGANKADILGIIVNNTMMHTNYHQGILNSLRGVFEDMVFETTIPRSIKVEESAGKHQTMVHYAPSHPVTLEMKKLVEECLMKLGMPKTKLKSVKNPESKGNISSLIEDSLQERVVNL